MSGAATAEELRAAEERAKAQASAAAASKQSDANSLTALISADQLQAAEARAKAKASGAAAQSGRQNTLLSAAACRTAADKLDPEMVKMLMGNFTDSVKKTPCWEVAGALRCLPSFYLAGSFHSGAGTLTAKLMAHPDIMTGQSSNTQFWAEFAKDTVSYINGFDAISTSIRQAPDTKVLMDTSQSTFAFYWSAGTRAHPGFRKTMEACWKDCSDKANGDASRDDCVTDNCFGAAQAADLKVIGEAGISFDDAHVPLLLHAAYGDWPVKMAVLLRNPIDRLHSAYWGYSHYKDHYGATAEGFSKYVEEQVSAFEQCSKQHSMAKCALYFESLGMEFEKFIRGMYAVFLERWLRHIPRTRMLIIRSEDYFASSEKIVREVLQFLSIEAPLDLTGIMGAGTRMSYATSAPAILPATLERLRKFYELFNAELAELLGDKAYLDWNG